MTSINLNWTNENGLHDGGVSTGIGYTIAWQRGPVVGGSRNGAFLIEVLQSCMHQLEYYQEGPFACEENKEALKHLQACILELQERLNRRHREGILGTHVLDSTSEE